MKTVLVHEEKYVGPTAMLNAFEMLKTKTRGVPPVVVLPTKKGKGKEKTMKNELSDLLDFQVSEMTPEEIAAKQKETEERRANAQTLASKIISAKEEVKKIEAIKDWDANPDLIAKRDGLLTFLEKAEVAGDETFQASLAVSTLINEIKAMNPKSDVEVEVRLRQVAEIGRGELKSAKDLPTPLPEGTVRFKDVCLLHKKSAFHLDKVASPADQSIFKALREMIGSYLKKIDKEKLELLKKKGNLDLFKLKEKVPSFYVICFPEWEDKKHGKHWQEGVGLVRLMNISKTDTPFWVIKAIDGAGSLRWLADHRDEWVPFPALLTGKVVEEKTPPEKLPFSQKFAKTINKSLGIFEWEARKNKK